MKYSRVIILVGHPEHEKFDCGCDQTFALGRLLHQPDQRQWLIEHDRGFLTEAEAEPLKTKCFDEYGGI